MIVCPQCGAENIEGADACDECQQTLWDLSLPVPATAIEADLLRDRIARLKPKAPTCVSADTTVQGALETMIDQRIGCLVVVDQADDGRLVGIFSERDALLKINTDAARFADQPISKFMTPNPVTLRMSDKIAFALHKMDVGGYRHIPILDEQQLAGIISIRDILGYLTERIHANTTSAAS